MEQSSATGYFRDLYELGADPSLSLEEKIARAITVGRDRLDVSDGLLSHVDDGDYEIVDSTVSSGDYDSSRLGLFIVERVVSGHGWQGEVTVDDDTRFVFSDVGTVADPLRS
ncbi:hypothetical protein BRC88_08285 [Halobacteriales archaeon QS_4_69_225]|nr:MAG: hypothetical protein BRC88_08285 [Halobacteriales archaeon QS_4_69_225]